MAGQPNPRPSGTPAVPGGPPVQGAKTPFPADAFAGMGNNPGVTPQMGRNPHLGTEPPGGSNLAKKKVTAGNG